MHVLIISSEFPTKKHPNAGIYVYEQAKAISRFGVKVGAIFPDQRWPSEIRSLSDLYSIDVKVDDGINILIDNGVIIPKLSRVLYLMRSRVLFKKYVEKFGMPDVIHAHFSIWAGYAAEELSKHYKIPYLVTEHSSAFVRNLYGSQKLKYSEKAFANSSCSIAVSGFLQERINASLSNSIEFKILPNFITFKPIAIREKNKNSEICFIAVSSLTKLKSVDVIIKAFSEVRKTRQQARLVIVGDGPERRSLENLVSELSLEEYVEFKGELSPKEVYHNLEKADIFVHASKIETFGIALIEAMAFGLPAVCTNCGGPSDIINKENGLLVPIDNIAEFAKSMNSIAENFKDYDSCNIQKEIIEKYSEEKICGELLNIYKNIIGSIDENLDQI